MLAAQKRLEGQRVLPCVEDNVTARVAKPFCRNKDVVRPFLQSNAYHIVMEHDWMRDGRVIQLRAAGAVQQGGQQPSARSKRLKG